MGKCYVKGHGTPQEKVGIKVSEDKICIRYRRMFPALFVTGRSGVCTRTFRTDLEQAEFADPRNAAASGSNLHQVHNRHLNGKTAAFFKALDTADFKGGHKTCMTFLDKA